MKVDISVSPSLDRLVITPRDRSSDSFVKSALSISNPNLRINKSVEGLWVDSADIWKLRIEEAGFEFSWNELSEKFVQNRRRVKKQMPGIIEQIKSIQRGGKLLAARYLKGGMGMH